MSKTKTSSPKLFEIVSSDPEVMALQAMIRGMHHFNSRQLTMRHVKVLMATELWIKAVQAKAFPRANDIGTACQLTLPEFQGELRDLVEKRYLHEIVPPFGDIRYKIGAMGGTVLRTILGRKRKQASDLI